MSSHRYTHTLTKIPTHVQREREGMKRKTNPRNHTHPNKEKPKSEAPKEYVLFQLMPASLRLTGIRH